ATVINSSLEDIERQVAFDTTATNQIGTGSDVTTLLASGASMATATGDNPQTNVEQQLREEMKVEVPVTEENLKPPEAEILASVNVKGQTTETTAGGVEGAIDRLAMELANSLHE